MGSDPAAGSDPMGRDRPPLRGSDPSWAVLRLSLLGEPAGVEMVVGVRPRSGV